MTQRQCVLGYVGLLFTQFRDPASVFTRRYLECLFSDDLWGCATTNSNQQELTAIELGIPLNFVEAIVYYLLGRNK